MKTFLSAEWRKLLMVNYAVDPHMLEKYVPPRTELDKWNDTCYVSLVGFMFLNTKLKGIKIPFHSNFEEVNLRFYVRHRNGSEWRRGVVFIKEIVPKPALTLVANLVYKENYETMKMRHKWNLNQKQSNVEYAWKKNGWHSVQVLTEPTDKEIIPGSEEEFITEHYWGYTRVNENQTSEYKVEHPRWNVYTVLSHHVGVNFKEVYGNDFAILDELTPKSVFLAEGSEIKVLEARLI